MNKRERKQAEERLFSAVEVPDRVLDAARAELEAGGQNRCEERRGAAAAQGAPAAAEGGAAVRAVPRARVWVIAAALLLAVVAAVLLVLCMLPQRNSGSAPAYALAQLQEREIGSVSAYNAQSGTAYLGAADGADGLAYSDGVRDVLLCERFSAAGADCLLYVLTDASGSSVDVLEPFYGLQDVMMVAGQEVFYDEGAPTSARFSRGGAGYFLTVQGGAALADIVGSLLGGR